MFNDYEFARDLDELLHKHGLVAEERSIAACRRGWSTQKDRLHISIVAKEAP